MDWTDEDIAVWQYWRDLVCAALVRNLYYEFLIAQGWDPAITLETLAGSCLYCGTPIRHKRIDSKYCSTVCLHAVADRRYAEKRKARRALKIARAA